MSNCLQSPVATLLEFTQWSIKRGTSDVFQNGGLDKRSQEDR